MSDEAFVQGAVESAPESEPTASPETESHEAPGEESPPEPKTFTQEELDRIIGAEKAKIERKVRRELESQLEARMQVSPAEAPNPDNFRTVGEYVDALADWKAEQRIQEQDSRRRQAEATSTFYEREEKTRAKYDDFERVAYNGDLPVTEAMRDVILTSQVGPEILYHLGKNPRDAARIAELDPLNQARELGKIEAKLTDAPVPVKKVSSAPEPINPVGSRASTPNYSTSDPRSIKAMSMDEWAQQRMKEMSKRH